MRLLLAHFVLLFVFSCNHETLLEVDSLVKSEKLFKDMEYFQRGNYMQFTFYSKESKVGYLCYDIEKNEIDSIKSKNYEDGLVSKFNFFSVTVFSDFINLFQKFVKENKIIYVSQEFKSQGIDMLIRHNGEREGDNAYLFVNDYQKYKKSRVFDNSVVKVCHNWFLDKKWYR